MWSLVQLIKVVIWYNRKPQDVYDCFVKLMVVFESLSLDKNQSFKRGIVYSVGYFKRHWHQWKAGLFGVIE